MTYHPYLETKFPIHWVELTPEQAKIDITYAMQLTKERMDSISNLSDDQITYDSVFTAFDNMDLELDQGSTILDHLTSVRDNEPLRAVYKELNPKVTDFYTQVFLNSKLYNVIKKAAGKVDETTLTAEQTRFIEQTLLSFKLNGADLIDEQKESFAKIEVELAELTEKFKSNVLDSTNAFELYVDDVKELEGLPQSSLNQAAESAERKGHKGSYLFTLHFPSMRPVMMYAKSENLRKKIYEGSCSIGHSSEFENNDILLRIVKLRDQEAKILGFRSFADLVLSRRMASNGSIALHFVDDLHNKVHNQFIEESDRLREYKAKITGDDKTEVFPWERLYYSELLRREKYDFDEESLRPYFPVDKVMHGVFTIASTLYGMEVKEKPTFYRQTVADSIDEGKVEVWHPDVKYYEVFDKKSGDMIGGFYADWHPREDKRSGAWHRSFYNLYPSNPRNLSTICGNIQKPSGGKPALLNHSEVETIFHEFGHMCHALLTKATVRTFSGTKVARDFVELPSQFLENWTWERSALDLFAAHFETGEKIPDEIFNKMISAKNYNSATFMMRQLSFGKIDLEIHHHFEKYQNMNVDQINDLVLADYIEKCSVKRTSILYSFGHLFNSSVGYAAGYYSYMWAKELEADAFTRFKKEGILNENVGKEFRDKILIWGNSKRPDQLFRDFMGRNPDPTALLTREGIKI